MKFKSIMSRIIISVVPIIAISIALFVVIISGLIWSQINAQINDKMEEHLKKSELAIYNEFSMNSGIAHSLAVYAETCSAAAIEGGEMKDFLMKVITTNKNTFGGGIWYEPYFYPGKEFFGPYVHVDGGAVIYEADYAGSVNYHKEEWYENGRLSKGETIWSSVYYDPVTETTMITATVPFFDGEGKFQGVATTDMSLTDIRNIVRNISLGSTGKAFILGKSGEYIAFYDDTRKIDDKITAERDANLAAFGRRALETGEGIDTIDSDAGLVRAFYMTLPETGWVLVIMMDDGEISAIIRDLVLMASSRQPRPPS
ncbi:MAG: hypothetical protein LBQ56_07175 [Synergistaceae bacterium]|jgi:methyl-accepting chemotaxis protein|nr:hypothetical protein [Synergistaceae bacterium]